MVEKTEVWRGEITWSSRAETQTHLISKLVLSPDLSMMSVTIYVPSCRWIHSKDLIYSEELLLSGTLGTPLLIVASAQFMEEFFIAH